MTKAVNQPNHKQSERKSKYLGVIMEEADKDNSSYITTKVRPSFPAE
jgi:hypothetical protein